MIGGHPHRGRWWAWEGHSVCLTPKIFLGHNCPRLPSPVSRNHPCLLGNGVNSTADVLVTLLGSSSTRWYSKMALRRDSETEAEPVIRNRSRAEGSEACTRSLMWGKRL